MDVVLKFGECVKVRLYEYWLLCEIRIVLNLVFSANCCFKNVRVVLVCVEVE